MSESLEEARMQEAEEKRKEGQIKGLLRMALSEHAYERLMNVKLANSQLYGLAANQVFNLYQKAGRKLSEKELVVILKAIKGTQRETKITFK